MIRNIKVYAGKGNMFATIADRRDISLLFVPIQRDVSVLFVEWQVIRQRVVQDLEKGVMHR